MQRRNVASVSCISLSFLTSARPSSLLSRFKFISKSSRWPSRTSVSWTSWRFWAGLSSSWRGSSTSAAARPTQSKWVWIMTSRFDFTPPTQHCPARRPRSCRWSQRCGFAPATVSHCSASWLFVVLSCIRGVRVNSVPTFCFISLILSTTFSNESYHSIANKMAKQIHYVTSRLVLIFWRLVFLCSHGPPQGLVWLLEKLQQVKLLSNQLIFIQCSKTWKFCWSLRKLNIAR